MFDRFQVFGRQYSNLLRSVLYVVLEDIREQLSVASFHKIDSERSHKMNFVECKAICFFMLLFYLESMSCSENLYTA